MLPALRVQPEGSLLYLVLTSWQEKPSSPGTRARKAPRPIPRGLEEELPSRDRGARGSVYTTAHQGGHHVQGGERLRGRPARPTATHAGGLRPGRKPILQPVNTPGLSTTATSQM